MSAARPPAWGLVLATGYAVACADEDWVYRARDAAPEVARPDVLDVEAPPSDSAPHDAPLDESLTSDVPGLDVALPADRPLDDAAIDISVTTDRMSVDAATPTDVGQDVAAVRDEGNLPDVPVDACASGTVPCAGRCVAVASDPSNCGGCGRRCARANSEAQCADGVCRLVRCLDGWMDCNRDPADGCERETRTDPANCGGCGLPCSFPEATAGCEGGRCVIARCNRRYLDCDGDAANGCEVDLITDARHCEVCGNACPTGASCQSGCVRTAPFAGYTVGEPPPEVIWVDACALPGAVHHLPDTDTGYARGEIPFPVPFWGRTNRRYVVSPDGLVGFGLDLYTEGNYPMAPPYRSWGALPARDIPYPAAFVFGVDLVTGPDGACVATVGVAPTRRFIVAWPNARFVAFGPRPLDASLPRVSAEAIFYETSGIIDFLYQAPFDTPTGAMIMAQAAVTIGLVDYRSGSPVRAVPFSGSIGAGTRVRFTPL